MGGTTEYNFLGLAGDLVIYSHPDFGLTQGYDLTNHSLVWENATTVLWRIVDTSSTTVIGELDEGRTTSCIGLDLLTGTEEWDAPYYCYGGKIINEYFLISDENVVYLLNPQNGSEITNIPTQSGYVFDYRLMGSDLLIFSKTSNGTALLSVAR
jgi:hypothetical protein